MSATTLDRVGSAQRIGYVTSRFPKTTETFIVREILAVESVGHDVSIYAIRREDAEIVHSGAAHLVDRLLAVSDLGASAAAAQWRWARRSPRRLARVWWRAMRGNIASPAFLARALVIAWGAPAIAEAVQRDRIDRLHAHWATHAALLAHLVHVLTDVPYSITLHAHDLYVDRTMLDVKLRDCSAAVTISEHNAELIRSEYPDVADRVQVVRCGVDIDRTAPSVDRPLRTPDDPLRIVTVARFEPMKGHADLLTAAKLIHATGRAVQLDLVGDGDGRAEIARHTPPWVFFHGAVDGSEVERLVRGSDLMVLPCIEMPDGRRDGIPVALMEAMALGVPVVSTTVSGIPELVIDGETGLLVPPGDPERLAAAILRLTSDAELAARLTAAARRHVEEYFDARVNGRRMAQLFAHPNHRPIPSHPEPHLRRPEDHMNISRHSTLHASLIGAAALLGALGAGIWGAAQPDRYSTSTTVAIAPAASLVDDGAVIDVVGGLDRGTIVETLAGLATSASVVSAAAEEIGIPAGDRDQYDISAVRVTSANLVDVMVSGPDPELVAELATATAATAAAQFGTLYRVYHVDVVAAADVPDTTDRPSVVLLALAGAVVAGLGAAIVVAASRARRRERHLATVRDPDEQRLAS